MHDELKSDKTNAMDSVVTCKTLRK